MFGRGILGNGASTFPRVAVNSAFFSMFLLSKEEVLCVWCLGVGTPATHTIRVCADLSVGWVAGEGTIGGYRVADT